MEENQSDLNEEVPPRMANTSSKKLAVIIAVFLAVTAGGLVVANNNLSKSKNLSNNNKSQQKEVRQAIISPGDGKEVSISNDDYFDITVGSSQYFGKLNKISNDYARLYPTAYKKADKLIFSGNELHSPEPMTYLRIDKITKLHKLDPADKDDVMVIALLEPNTAHGSDAYPANNINEYLKSDQFQAFFFTDGMVFFARASTLDGNFLSKASKVYVLEGQDGGPTETNTQSVLIVAKPEQYVDRSNADLVYWQNMRNDSSISKSVKEFENYQASH